MMFHAHTYVLMVEIPFEFVSYKYASKSTQLLHDMRLYLDSSLHPRLEH